MLKLRLMIHLTKRVAKKLVAFICEQYLVFFFIIALGLKLLFFSTYVIRVTWSDQFTFGIICGYASAALIFSPLYFVRKNKNKLAFFIASLFSLLLVIDTVYFSYFATLPTVGLLNSLGQTGDVAPAVGQLLHWNLLFYFSDVIIAAILIRPMTELIHKLKARYNLRRSDVRLSWVALLTTIIAFCLSLLPVGISTLSDVTNKGFDTITTSQYYGVLMAHAIDVARYIQEETTHLSASQEKGLNDWVKSNRPTQATDNLTGIAKGKNIIMIQIESLGGFVINQKFNGKEITPNLNKLSQTSQFFPNDRFEIGAGHTSDTDFVANTSYFPLDDAATFVRYGHDDFTSLPKTLVSNGYSSYAYHGYNRNFWNRDVAMHSLGYQKFYAANNYKPGPEPSINMGINDGDFLSQTADYIAKQPKPSFSYAITLSSHVPFNITSQTKVLGVNTKDYPDQVGGYLEDINYTDRSLGQFFDKLKNAGLYDSSLIVVYGDHTPVLPAFSAGTIKYDPTTVQQKEVPLIIKLPNETVGKTYINKGTHLDIMPTVLDLVGVKTNQLMFGQSLFTSGKQDLKECADQLVAFPSNGDCKSMLIDEKDKSSTIVRYNQFNNIQKK